MKIAKLHIKNHRVFDDVLFDFTDSNGKVLDTVVLAGVNGCGKTTVLEVIKGLMLWSIDPNTEIAMEVVGFEDFEDFENKSFFWEISNPDESSKYFNIKIEKFAEQQNELLKRLRAQENICMAYLPIKMEHKPTGTFSFFRLLNLDHHKADMKKVALRQIYDEIFKNRDQAPADTIKRQVQKITKALDGMDLHSRLVDIQSEELIFESANGKRIGFDDLSNGEQQLYFRAIYLNLLDINDGVIMIDEPETALHPTWQQKVTQLYSKIGKNNQVFMATHSPHIMASVPPESLFILHINEKTQKVNVINAAKANLHTKGVETNRILKEVMEVKMLRDWETERDIERLTSLLNIERFENQETEDLANKLTQQLGREDAFIMRLEHQLLMLRRKRENLSAQKA